LICTCPQLDDKQLLVFGGLNKRERYNDVWVLDWDSKAWRQVVVQGAAPEPRAHFTATRFGSRIFIFGGYGGSGQVFNDMWLLHVGADGAFRWENVSESVEGTPPTPRFDHSAFIYPITPNSSSFDKLLIMGGRDLTTMFQDSHMLDLNRMAWEDTQPPMLPYEICNNLCDGIESVPHHKVFSFGGKKGMMQYMNTVEVGLYGHACIPCIIATSTSMHAACRW
jgi:dynein heavy chain, axonemal